MCWLDRAGGFGRSEMNPIVLSVAFPESRRTAASPRCVLIRCEDVLLEQPLDVRRIRPHLHQRIGLPQSAHISTSARTGVYKIHKTKPLNLISRRRPVKDVTQQPTPPRALETGGEGPRASIPRDGDTLVALRRCHPEALGGAVHWNVCVR